MTGESVRQRSSANELRLSVAEGRSKKASETGSYRHDRCFALLPSSTQYVTQSTANPKSVTLPSQIKNAIAVLRVMRQTCDFRQVYPTRLDANGLCLLIRFCAHQVSIQTAPTTDSHLQNHRLQSDTQTVPAGANAINAKRQHAGVKNANALRSSKNARSDQEGRAHGCLPGSTKSNHTIDSTQACLSCSDNA